jgi:hypothetical protein
MASKKMGQFPKKEGIGLPKFFFEHFFCNQSVLSCNIKYSE